MYVAMLCNKEVITVEQTASLTTAAQTMRDHQAECLAVVATAAGRRSIVGLVTEHDLTMGMAEGLDPERTPLASLECQPAVRISTGASIDDAIALMLRQRVRRLMVVGPDGRLAGLLDFDALLLALAGQFAGLAQAAPARSAQPASSRDALEPARRARGLHVDLPPPGPQELCAAPQAAGAAAPVADTVLSD